MFIYSRALRRCHEITYIPYNVTPFGPFRNSVSGRINLNVWNYLPSCKRIPAETYEIIPLKSDPLNFNLIVLVRRTIDNRRGKLLTNLAGPWTNKVERGDSVKRGVDWSTGANEQRKRQRNHQSYAVPFYP